jgi:hypothetical protein
MRAGWRTYSLKRAKHSEASQAVGCLHCIGPVGARQSLLLLRGGRRCGRGVNGQVMEKQMPRFRWASPVPVGEWPRSHHERRAAYSAMLIRVIAFDGHVSLGKHRRLLENISLSPGILPISCPARSGESGEDSCSVCNDCGEVAIHHPERGSQEAGKTMIGALLFFVPCIQLRGEQWSRSLVYNIAVEFLLMLPRRDSSRSGF